MRRISTLSVLCLAAGVMSACSLPDEIIPTENIPTAGVRFINAVPDTIMADMRFVDIVESNAHFRIGFRANPVTANGVPASTQVQYKNARAGMSRHFRVFVDDTLQANASHVFLDTTFTPTAGSNYTVMMWGNSFSSGADKMHFSIWEDAPTDPAANVAIRVINATNAVINARQYLSTGTAPVAATWAAIPAYGCIGACGAAGNWVTVAPTTGAQTIKVNVRDAGDVTALSGLGTDASALIGSVATASTVGGLLDIPALPGTAAAGSAITAIVYPPSVVGSKAVQFATAGTSFGIAFVWDRRPPTGCGTGSSGVVC
ncbi:MAG TPA: DUF4397 domain-containing protein [Gemmatimonadaceae bacterium]